MISLGGGSLFNVNPQPADAVLSKPTLLSMLAAKVKAASVQRLCNGPDRVVRGHAAH